jgi:hypothetical protein
MNDPINFEIEELVARYELHPHRQDVFVEGERDVGFLRIFLENKGHSGVAVFSVAVVNVPAHMLFARNLPHPSRRSAVITLALELEQLGVSPMQAACIADADFEYLLPEGIQCSLLLLTDYASMELYAFSSATVHSVLTLVASSTAMTGAGLVGNLSGPLQFLFSARAANVYLQFGLAWIEGIDKFFGIQNGILRFDEAEFMKRYLVDRLPIQEVTKFKARLAVIQSQLTSDIRCRIRGHDFIQVFTWYLRTIERCRHLNEDSVRQLLFLAVDKGDLGTQPMFLALLKRLTR